MQEPSWQDSQLGTMKRAALWLIQEVGEGQVFTKEDLRRAFPGVSQIDRRMRDLRAQGWQIATNREDVSLGLHEQRFVKTGARVWEPGGIVRPTGLSLTAKQKRSVMSRDGNFCRSCGITPGQMYDDGTYETAQLDIARRRVRGGNGQVGVQLVTECTRCRIGAIEDEVDMPAIESRVDALPAFEKKILSQWIRDDGRGFSETEALWAAYRALPQESRDQIQAMLQ